MWELFDRKKKSKLGNKLSKLTEINKCTKKDSKKLKIKQQPKWIEYWKTSKASNTITKQKRSSKACCEDITDQTIEKVLDKDKYLAKRILTLFRDQGITIIPVLTVLSMTFLTIVLTVIDVFGGRGGPAASGSPKDEGTFK